MKKYTIVICPMCASEVKVLNPMDEQCDCNSCDLIWTWQDSDVKVK